MFVVYVRFVWVVPMVWLRVLIGCWLGLVVELGLLFLFVCLLFVFSFDVVCWIDCLLLCGLFGCCLLFEFGIWFGFDYIVLFWFCCRLCLLVDLVLNSVVVFLTFLLFVACMFWFIGLGLRWVNCYLLLGCYCVCFSLHGDCLLYYVLV